MRRTYALAGSAGVLRFAQDDKSVSTKTRAVIFKDAAVHHYEDACLARLFRGLLVDYAFLHPDGGNFQLDRLIYNLLDKLRAAKNIHDIDLLRHIEQRCVSLFAQAFLNLRIHWNDAVPVSLHVG